MSKAGREVNGLPDRGRHFAFTLLEMLCVVAVIGILAAAMLPTMKNAFSKADIARCSLQMKQVFGAAAAYAADHRGCLPSRRNPAEPGAAYSEKIWNDSVYGALLLVYPDYLQDKNVFVCPSDHEPGRKHWDSSGKNGLYTSYFAYRDLNTEGQTRRFTMTDPNYGAALPLMGDAAKANFHKTGYNVCFMDGHIEFVPASMYQKAPFVNFFWE